MFLGAILTSSCEWEDTSENKCTTPIRPHRPKQTLFCSCYRRSPPSAQERMYPDIFGCAVRGADRYTPYPTVWLLLHSNAEKKHTRIWYALLTAVCHFVFALADGADGGLDGRKRVAGARGADQEARGGDTGCPSRHDHATRAHRSRGERDDNNHKININNKTPLPTSEKPNGQRS